MALARIADLACVDDDGREPLGQQSPDGGFLVGPVDSKTIRSAAWGLIQTTIAAMPSVVFAKRWLALVGRT